MFKKISLLLLVVVLLCACGTQQQGEDMSSGPQTTASAPAPSTQPTEAPENPLEESTATSDTDALTTEPTEDVPPPHRRKKQRQFLYTISKVPKVTHQAKTKPLFA